MSKSKPPHAGDGALQPKKLILLGQITGAHGIRGDVIVRSYADNPVDIASYGPLSDKDGRAPLSLTVLRASDKGVVVRVAGVADRNAAEALRGRELYIERSKLPAAGDAEYYHADLIGLDAVTADGQAFGVVAAVQNFGAGDLLEIRLAGTRDIEYIPFTNACVPHVELDAGRLTVVPPVMTGEPEPADDAATADRVGDDPAER